MGKVVKMTPAPTPRRPMTMREMNQRIWEIDLERRAEIHVINKNSQRQLKAPKP